MTYTPEEEKEFIAEAEDLLDEAEKGLLALDQGAKLSEHYDSIFRALHSIKGAAGMMEMTPLQSHMHQLESIFMEQKTLPALPKAAIDFYLRGADAARKLLNHESIEFNYSFAENSNRAPEPTKPATEAIPVAEPNRVIVVDDEPQIVMLLEKMLTVAGMKVLGLTRSTEVLNAVKNFEPDVILSDISMPDMDGLQLLTAVKEKYPDLPVIFVSGYVNKQALLVAIQQGLFGVVEKPFNADQIVNMANSATSKHRLSKLLNSSINLLMYQFSDLKSYLMSEGKTDVAQVIEKEIHSLLAQRRLLRRKE